MNKEVSNVIRFVPANYKYFEPQMNWIVKAKTIKNILYTFFDGERIIPCGSELSVDLETNIATFGNDKFDIEASEFCVLNQN